jgi:hypothetical protein
MLNLKSDDIETVKASLAQIANTSSTLELVAVEYSQSRGYFDASYEKTAPLSDLQQRVVDTLNPLRDGMRKNDIARLSEATGKMLENYQKYGWNSIGELYRPHLTLARFISEETKPENLPVFTEFSGLYNRLGIFEMGDNGTCVRELGSWDLV